MWNRVRRDKFRKFSFISEKIGKEDRAFVDARFVLPAFGLLVFRARVEKEPFDICEFGRQHCLADMGFSLEEEIENSGEIGEHAEKDQGSRFQEGEIAREQDIIIPEGQECLEVILPGEGAASDMIDYRCGTGVDLVADIAGPPAEIDVFLMHVIIIIETAHLME